MTVLDQIPAVLPGGLTTISPSSLDTYLRCPEKWRRRYLENEFEPAGAKMILGKAIGRATALDYQQKIESRENLPVADVVDAFRDAVEFERDTQEIAWGDDKPDEIVDAGARLLPVYHERVAVNVQPVTVERKFAIQPEGAEWTITGYLDLEQDDGAIIDVKSGKRRTDADLRVNVQASTYLLGRREEARAGFGQPAPEFRWHNLVNNKTPDVVVLPTTRTDAQLDALYWRYIGVAAEIVWRTETGRWQGAVPGSWWCGSKFCGHWDSCAMGGMR